MTSVEMVTKLYVTHAELTETYMKPTSEETTPPEQVEEVTAHCISGHCDPTFHDHNRSAREDYPHA